MSGAPMPIRSEYRLPTTAHGLVRSFWPGPRRRPRTATQPAPGRTTPRPAYWQAGVQAVRVVEVMPPDTNHRSSFAGQRLRLGGRKPAASSCRDEVVAALARLAALDRKQVFTVREVYAEMMATGTSYAESTVFKTMQRMKGLAGRSPYARLERVGKEGFRLLNVSS